MKKIFLSMFILVILTFRAVAQNVVNGNFDQGASSGWTKYSQGGYGLIGTAQFFYSTEIAPQVLPRSGEYIGRLGGYSYEINSIKQTVTLPNTQKVYLGLYYQTRASTTSECAGLWVGAQIRVYVAGQVLSDQYLCNYNAVNAWTFGYFDISAAAGQTVEIGFRADAANSVWSYIYLDDVSIFTSLTEIEDQKESPQNFTLAQNFPNPFNPTTNIEYSVAQSQNVTIKIYNVLGKEVAVLVNEKKEPGTYMTEFKTNGLPSGLYFYRMKTGGFVQTKKMMIVK
ncbi:MAG: T9SS type A sorting domain-containing protein [Ignavibacteriaceae bacterium]|jgi:hypothetical protein